ncbi:MAG TPA: hypothetical protein VGM08_01320 [Candidatus Saccharimonadales bacterium]|jgi:hypothetical protein
MTATNHLLTGAILGKFLPLPVAIPLAFASHFILDALPHFGFPSIDIRIKHLGLLKTVICADIFLSVLLSVWLIHARHAAWFLTGLVAYSPDVFWIYRFTVEEKFGKVHPTKGNRFVQLHRNIQKYERIWGGLVEMLYGGALLLLVR